MWLTQHQGPPPSPWLRACLHLYVCLSASICATCVLVCIYMAHSLLSQPPFFTMLPPANNWLIGGLFLATASLSVSIWTTSQAAILKAYPSELTIVAFYCFFGTIQCTVISLIAERSDPNAWKIRTGIELTTIIYSGVFGSVVTFWVQTWCIHKKGPVYVSMFKPLGIAIAALFGVFFLGDTPCRKTIEEEENGGIQAAATDHEWLPSLSNNTPLLLQNHSDT